MMPAIFVGHGSHINIIEENEYTLGWKQTAESFYPLLYALRAATEQDEVTDCNHSCTAGSMSMTSYVFSKGRSAI